MKNLIALMFSIVLCGLCACTPVHTVHTWALSDITGISEVEKEKMEKVTMTTCGDYFAQKTVEDGAGQISIKIFVGSRNPGIPGYDTERKYSALKEEFKTIIIENYGGVARQFAVEDIRRGELQIKYILYITPEYYDIVAECVPEPFSKTQLISIS